MDIRDKVLLRLLAIEDQQAAAGRERTLAKMKGDDETAELCEQQRVTLLDEWNRVIHTVTPEAGNRSVPVISREDTERMAPEQVDAMLNFTKSLGLPLQHDVGSECINVMVKHKLDELAWQVLTIEHFAQMMGGGQPPADDDPFDLGLGDLEF